MKEQPAEFYEAQCRSKCDGKWSCWFRLGGNTLAHAREAVDMSRKSLGLTAKMIDVGDEGTEYRIRHFVGTVETVE